MAYPIFVLEGPDNGGKSTLAKEIARQCNGKVIHATYRFKGRMYQYHMAQFRMALRKAQNNPVIMDRWWPSEVAYGNTYRDGCEYAKGIPDFVKLGKMYHVSYTYCMPTRFEEYWEGCKQVWKSEEEMYELDEARYNLLWQNYRELAVQQYGYYPRDLIQNYNWMLSGNRSENRPSGIARWIIARMMTELRALSQEQKDLMNRMTTNWKEVGRNTCEHEDDSGLAAAH